MAGPIFTSDALAREVGKSAAAPICRRGRLQVKFVPMDDPNHAEILVGPQSRLKSGSARSVALPEEVPGLDLSDKSSHMGGIPVGTITHRFEIGRGDLLPGHTRSINPWRP